VFISLLPKMIDDCLGSLACEKLTRFIGYLRLSTEPPDFIALSVRHRIVVDIKAMLVSPTATQRTSLVPFPFLFQAQ
jgi:hypothetical protein